MAAEVDMVVKKEAAHVVSTRAVKEAVVTKPQPIKIEPAMAKLNVEPTVPNHAIARLQSESDVFGSKDDSFDEHLSQMNDPWGVEEAPLSSVLKMFRPRTSHQSQAAFVRT